MLISLGLTFKVIAFDPNAARRAQVAAIIKDIEIGEYSRVEFADPKDASSTLKELSTPQGCHAVLEERLSSPYPS